MGNDTADPCEFRVEEVHTGQWFHAKAVLSRFSDDWVFRGQLKAEWALTTAIERLRIQVSMEHAESRMLTEFRRRAHHYTEAAALPEQTLDLLALMQHYGAPTRLLDCTRSPYVAAYFALEAISADYDQAAIWCINETWCREQARRCVLAANSDANNLPLYFEFCDPHVFDSYLIGGGCKVAVPIEPFRLHHRMTAQQGLFLCPGNLEVPLMENLAAMHEGKPMVLAPVQKVIVPGLVQAEALQDLNRMNINRATLFPGIEGLARSLPLRLVGLRDAPWEKAIHPDATADHVVPPDAGAIRW